MNPADNAYVEMLQAIVSCGTRLPSRQADTTTRRLTGYSVRFYHCPLVSVRRTAWKNCLREWEWFMKGSNDIKDLHGAVRPWWTPFADRNGLCPNNYSVQFRNSGGRVVDADGRVVVGGFDQINYLVHCIRHDPFGRRGVITAWDTRAMADPATKLPNCHGTVVQAFVEPDKSLHLSTWQRSCDVVCGVPHNWFQYWAFLTWLAYLTNLRVGSLHWTGGDVHVYSQHDDLVEKIIAVRHLIACTRPFYLNHAPTGEAFIADEFSLDRTYQPILDESAVLVV